MTDLSTLPARMQSLPLDERGYPVPWFVPYIDGKPEFRGMEAEKFIAAIRRKLCWVCGERLGVNMAFVAGPMCGINRTAPEPPSHVDCARWSARNCPFLSNPRMVRREDETVNNQQLRENSAGICLTRNPGVAMVWICRAYEVFDDGNGKPIITMGAPESVEWWACGHAATREEVDASIDGGLPALVQMAMQERGGIKYLNQSVQRFQKWLPTAPQAQAGPVGGRG